MGLHARNDLAAKDFSKLGRIVAPTSCAGSSRADETSGGPVHFKPQGGGDNCPAAPSDSADQRVESYEMVWSTDSWSRATSSSISMRWARQWTAGSPSTFLVCELSSSEKRGRRAGVG